MVNQTFLITPIDKYDLPSVNLFYNYSESADDFNLTRNVNFSDNLQPENLLIFLILSMFCIATVFGNILVIIAVKRERTLHTVTNYFIMSLAVADCLVGAIVMPFSAVYDSMGGIWYFGHDMCDVWHSFDVLASTASILNLVVISLDRYWAILDPFTYPSKMTSRSAKVLISLVWLCSSLISFPAIAWWRAVSPPPVPYDCLFTEDVGYLIFSSLISFWGPMLVMHFTCWRIYRTASRQSKCLKMGSKAVNCNGEGLTLRIHRGGTTRRNKETKIVPHLTRALGVDRDENREEMETAMLQIPIEQDEILTAASPYNAGNSSTNNSVRVVSKNFRNFSISRRIAKITKETKAAKTLGIVMGVFTVCWLPFFIVNNLLIPLCPQIITNRELTFAVVTWLGWVNSGMNPIIYAARSQDFRR